MVLRVIIFYYAQILHFFVLNLNKSLRITRHVCIFAS